LWKRISSPAKEFAALRPRGAIHCAQAHIAPATSSTWTVLFGFFPGDHLWKMIHVSRYMIWTAPTLTSLAFWGGRTQILLW
jgi:hypothetical protein